MPVERIRGEDEKRPVLALHHQNTAGTRRSQSNPREGCHLVTMLVTTAFRP
jgi:hypothetical protein